MKGYFIIRSGFTDKASSGIYRKILMQVKALNKAGLNCELRELNRGCKNNSILSKVLYILPFSNINPCWEYSEDYCTADYIYIRRPTFISVSMRRTLKRIKKTNPNVKILLEIPTYPYDNEYLNWIMKLLLIKDKYNRTHLKGLVDRIVCIPYIRMNCTTIWNIPYISIINGIDNSEVIPSKLIQHEGINIICVSTCEKWHGYDRLIKGLIKYYDDNKTENKEKIHIHLVGEGPELPFYKRLVDDGGISGYVTFYGRRFGKELDNIYDYADLCVGCLGIHRRGAEQQWSSELKSRESIAKGIPFISSCDIDVFLDHPFNYFLKLEASEEDIEIPQIISFYNSIYNGKDRTVVSKEITEYARDYTDINSTLLPVINYIKS